MSFTHSALLELRDTSVTWRAGVPGCLVTLRLLDRLHLVVHAGDCVLIRHADPAAAQVLVATLSGQSALDRLQRIGNCRVVRETHPTLRVRRTSIAESLVDVLCAAWRTPVDERVRAASSCAAPLIDAPVLHVLRASRRTAAPSALGAQAAQAQEHTWRTWVQAQRMRGGALVVLHDTRTAPEPVGRVREPEPPWGTQHRALRLSAGRLVAAGDEA